MDFGKLDIKIDPKPLMDQLEAHPELWGGIPLRLWKGSPHDQTTDIWVRYRDPDAYTAKYGSDLSYYSDEHEAVWLPPSEILPAAKELAVNVAGNRRIGGVFITKTPPGRRVKPHIDWGWHAEQHDKFYVALQTRPGAVFCWRSGVIKATDGEVYWFNNNVPHWVNNFSDTDRIGMIVCLRR